MSHASPKYDEGMQQRLSTPKPIAAAEVRARDNSQANSVVSGGRVFGVVSTAVPLAPSFVMEPAKGAKRCRLFHLLQTVRSTGRETVK